MTSFVHHSARGTTAPLLLATLVTGLLASCGGDNTPTSPQGEQQQQITSTADAGTGGDEAAGAGAQAPSTASNAVEDSRWWQDCEADIAGIRASITALESYQGPYSVAAVLAPLNRIETRIYDGANVASLMENVHPDAALRDHARGCTTDYADLATRLSLSRGIYDAVSAVDVSEAAPDTQRFHQLTLQEFRLAGVDRDEATRNKVRKLNARITELGQEFDKNILEDVRYIEVPVEDLGGLPKDFIAGKSVDENGLVRLSTRYVDTIPVYTYAQSDEVRKMLRQQDRSRGYPANREVLKELLSVRHDLANLLGFATYADLVTNNKMIGSGDNAQAFIQRIHELAEPVAQRDMSRLLERLREIDPDAATVQRWQVSYLEELIRKEQYQIDAAALRQYFSYNKVEKGIFDLVEHLFDVRIVPWQTETWHPSVKTFEMYEGDELIGRFYLDMHPREGKYQHAAAFTYQTGIAGSQLPVSALVCNFAGGDDPDSPMEYAQVRTFLHEFGHLLHSLFGGDQRYARLSGIATEWDFVEAPSQMLEEWMYDLDTLQTFAINDAGEPIPAHLVEALQAARHFGEGVTTNIQMYYSALSLQYHHQNPASFDLTDKMLALESAYSPFPHQEDTYFYANLGHLNGYSAIYYTYMWSKVIAMDMFSKFEAEGLRDKATAIAYRDKILAPGGLRPAEVMVEDFLGRPYNFRAFSRYLTGEEADH